MTPVQIHRPSLARQIFSVDDSLDNLFLMEAILEDIKDCKVSSFTNGHAALEAIQQNPPALLLLDLMMPGMAGPELLRLLREDAELPHFPVIMVTAKDPSQIHPESIAQADDVVLKPLHIDHFLAKVSFQLSHSRVPWGNGLLPPKGTRRVANH